MTTIEKLKRKCQEVKKIADKASKGPWTAYPDDNQILDPSMCLVAQARSESFSTQQRDDNSAFIAASRQWPELIASLMAMIEKQERDIDKCMQGLYQISDSVENVVDSVTDSTEDRG